VVGRQSEYKVVHTGDIGDPLAIMGVHMRRGMLAGFVAVACALAVVGAIQLTGRSAHSALPLGLAVEGPAPPLPSGASWACPQAEALPVRPAQDGQTLVFISLDGKRTVDLVWPRGFSARLLDERAELIGRNGSVIARDGDVLDGIGGGLGSTGDAFHVCSVAGKGYDPIP
jgi:hypothetical protein